MPNAIEIVDAEIASLRPNQYRTMAETVSDENTLAVLQRIKQTLVATGTEGETLVSLVRSAAVQGDVYFPERTLGSILNHAMSEIGETAIEVNIANGMSYKTPGPDGVVGEALDAIGALIDLIYKADPTLTERDLVNKLRPKMVKWIESLAEQKR